MTEEPTSERVAVPVEWPIEDLPLPVAANQLAVQVLPGPGGDPESVVISVGLAQGPIGTTTEEQRARLEQMQRVKVQIVARFVLSPARAREFGELLVRSADQLDALTKGVDGS